MISGDHVQLSRRQYDAGLRAQRQEGATLDRIASALFSAGYAGDRKAAAEGLMQGRVRIVND